MAAESRNREQWGHGIRATSTMAASRLMVPAETGAVIVDTLKRAVDANDGSKLAAPGK